MTPEEAVRSYVYHPSAEEAAFVTLADVDEFEADGMIWVRHDHGRIERRLALIFAALALIGFGILIGLSIRVSL